MKKVDLHVHSKYSDHPSTWGHKVYNSPESFTEVETVYHQAKLRGMDFVTLTDHDDIRGSIELVKKFPHDTFISCEVTSYFPEDNCKVHILVFGISETQYEQLMDKASNLYDLRNYIADQEIAYSVAHATYDQDGKLSFEHIEKLVILFDIFEIINGGSDSQNNLLLHRYCQSLEPSTLAALISKHKLTPISDTPWVKGYTGGADDHCGILIGSAFTQVNSAETIDDFLDAIRHKKSVGNGMHGSFETFATGVIKHIHDYRNSRDQKYQNTKMSDFLDLFFEGRQGNLVKRFKKSQSLRFLKKKNSKTHNALRSLLLQISEHSEQDIATKLPNTFEGIIDLHDEMFVSVVTVFSKHLPEGDLFKSFNRLASLFPMTLLAMPFIGSMRHQVLKSSIKQKLIEGTKQHYTQKALWFTDTIDDLNGVSVTLRQISKHSMEHGYHLKLVTCVNENTIRTPLPENTLNLPPIKEITLAAYETQTICFPSLLNMMRAIIYERPDQIIISTPGPLGLGAMLCAKLMDLPVKAIYHTDFAEQLMRMTNEPMLARITDFAVNSFYKQADTVFVPSQFYIDKLATSGLNKEQLHIFPRGIDLDLYRPSDEPQDFLRRHQLLGEFTLIFAGRISEDKNLSLLCRLIKLANNKTPGLYNLLIVGDGPDLASLKSSLATQSNVHFSGRVESEELVKLYQSSDLLIFPSHTDTFGMVVLEAQACGVPCMVSNIGGPKEIILPEQTGWVISDDKEESWLQQIEVCKQIKENQEAQWQQLKYCCAAHVHKQNNWQPVFDALLGDECLLPGQTNSKVVPIIKSNQPSDEHSMENDPEMLTTKSSNNNQVA